MKYTSTITHQSKTDPAISFTVRHLTEGRRIKISLQLADKYDKIDTIRAGVSEIAERVKPLLAQAKADGSDVLSNNPDMADLTRKHRQMQSVERDEIIPTFVRALLVSVDGLEIDGAPATVESMIESGPPDLYAEIAKAVKHEMGMDEQETGNSEPLSTSTVQADGGTQITSAETPA
jgi:hypothetical protein